MTRDAFLDLAGSLVMAAPSGRRLSPGERSILAEGVVGHLILFRRNLLDRNEARDLIAEARDRIGRPSLVAADQEGGIVSAAAEVVGRAPSAMHLGAAGSPTLVRRWAARQAGLLRELGIGMNLAPVLDVQSAAWSAVIGTRSFGGDPALVARMGKAAVRGTLDGGVIPVGKHFPGHGGVRADSHLTLPSDARDLPAIRASALPPFQAAIRAGLPAVMIAHVSYPALGTGRGPATLSREVVHDLLRGGLGFRGVVMSDAVEMAGFPGERFIPEALTAGIDLFCVSRSLAAGRRVARALARALRSGEVDPEAARRAAERVGALAARPPGAPASPAETLSGEWKGIVRLGRGPFRPLPGEGWRALLPSRLAGRIAIRLDLSSVDARFGRGFRGERVRLYSADPGPEECRSLLEGVRGDDAVVLGLLGRGGYPEGQMRLLRALARRRTRLLAVALLDPHPLASWTGIERLFTFDFRSETLAALFEVLLGKKVAAGSFPLPGR